MSTLFKLIAGLAGALITSAITKGATTKVDTRKGGSASRSKNTDIYTDNKKTTIFVDRRKDGSIRVSEAPFNKKKS